MPTHPVTDRPGAAEKRLEVGNGHMNPDSSPHAFENLEEAAADIEKEGDWEKEVVNEKKLCYVRKRKKERERLLEREMEKRMSCVTYFQIRELCNLSFSLNWFP